MKKHLGFIFLCIVSTGCSSSFSEKHYFKSADAQGNPINYFRVSVSGNTFLSSSRYLSGYFDEKAVDSYFDQIAQPDKALFKDQASADGGNVQPLSGNLKNRKLVLLLSSNSDAISQQIGQFANNQAIMADLTRLVYRDNIKEAREAQTSAELQQARGQALADIGTAIITGLDENTNKSTAVTNLLFYANRLASEFGNMTSFKTLDEAKTWLDYNRTHIMEKR
jgi:hypothetical protein